MQPQAAIETHQLRFAFAGKPAVDGLDMRVEAGSIFGFLGPNGAGKTTTIRMLLGLLRPQSGSIAIFGHAMPRDRRIISRMTGAMVETPSLYPHLSGAENLSISRRMMGLAENSVDAALDTVGLLAVRAQKVQGYSLGMRQRLAIARALLANPKLLILDEPTNGLDPDAIRAMRRLIIELPEQTGATIFLSSHLLSEVQQMASHVGLMFAGRMLAAGKMDEILAGQGERLEVHVDDVAAAAATLTTLSLDTHVIDAHRLLLRLPADGGERALAIAVNQRLTEAGMPPSAIIPRRPDLEELYVDLTNAADTRRAA